MPVGVPRIGARGSSPPPPPIGGFLANPTPYHQGWIQDFDFDFFFWRGGGRKRLSSHTHHEREARLTAGVQGPPIRALEALGVFDALSLSCYLSLIFKSILIQNGMQKHS